VIGLGAASLLLAFLACLYAAGASVWGAVRGDRRLVDSGRRAIYALLALLTLSVVVIEAAFLRSDFSVELVADHSSTTTPTLYKLTAVWSSQAGSLLFWAWVLAIFSSVVLLATHNRHREVAPWATAVLAGIGAFFVGLMLLADGAYPFARLDPAPIEGVGLNPLLRHPAMAIHPPMLYSGYVGFAIPFAFAIGALITRRLDASWIRSTRRFALLAWAFLGLGLILGSRWSYMELGWGGYWGWDPVENAALMPWIAGTAFLHSIMVQEKRGMLRVWNVSLVVATFALALVGTLLVRSGILESIHAFGASTVGGPLLGLIAVVVAGSAALIVSRLDDLRSEKRIDSLLSREAVFLVNNLLLLGICAVVLWGTFFPLISEAVTGERSSLAAPWFQRYVPPLAIALVLFTGIGPLLAWRRVSAGRALGLLWRPAAAAAIVAAALVALTDAASEPLALALFALAAFALAALVQEFASGAAARRALSGGSRLRALVAMVSTNRRRYGGYIVHAGIAILFIGAAASSSFRASHDVRMRPGERTSVAGYGVSYERPTVSVDEREQRLTLGAVLAVRRDGERYATLHPSRNYYSSAALGGKSSAIRSFFEGNATSEVGRREGLTRDIWTAMRPDLGRLEPMIDGVDRRLERLERSLPPGDPRAQRTISFLQGQAIRAIAERYIESSPVATFRINSNPLILWYWLGGVIAVAGGVIAIWPAPAARRRRVSDVYAARVARELSRA
jgi:cytochrome c-type biogenesis protein CcmF